MAKWEQILDQHILDGVVSGQVLRNDPGGCCALIINSRGQVPAAVIEVFWDKYKSEIKKKRRTIVSPRTSAWYSPADVAALCLTSPHCPSHVFDAVIKRRVYSLWGTIAASPLATGRHLDQLIRHIEAYVKATKNIHAYPGEEGILLTCIVGHPNVEFKTLEAVLLRILSQKYSWRRSEQWASFQLALLNTISTQGTAAKLYESLTTLIQRSDKVKQEQFKAAQAARLLEVPGSSASTGEQELADAVGDNARRYQAIVATLLHSPEGFKTIQDQLETYVQEGQLNNIEELAALSMPRTNYASAQIIKQAYLEQGLGNGQTLFGLRSRGANVQTLAEFLQIEANQAEALSCGIPGWLQALPPKLSLHVLQQALELVLAKSPPLNQRSTKFSAGFITTFGDKIKSQHDAEALLAYSNRFSATSDQVAFEVVLVSRYPQIASLDRILQQLTAWLPFEWGGLMKPSRTARSFFGSTQVPSGLGHVADLFSPAQLLQDLINLHGLQQIIVRTVTFEKAVLLTNHLEAFDMGQWLQQALSLEELELFWELVPNYRETFESLLETVKAVLS